MIFVPVDTGTKKFHSGNRSAGQVRGSSFDHSRVLRTRRSKGVAGRMSFLFFLGTVRWAGTNL
jgi:hypothetical protein